MATRKPAPTIAANPHRLPDPPEREPDDMTSFKHLGNTGSVANLVKHLGNRNTTIVSGELYITRHPGSPAKDRRRPDLFIAFNVDPQVYEDENGYIISEQGKPPDFVMEIASRSTGGTDTGDKRRDYAGLGIPEYWRFDETGRFHDTKLAGDRLVNARYEPIPILETEHGVLQGYSEILNLNIRWDNGNLIWIDPATNRRIINVDDAEDGRIAERDGRIAERDGRITERDGRIQAEAKVKQLEEELRRLRGQ